MPERSGPPLDDTHPPIAPLATRRRVARRRVGSAVTIAGIPLLLLSLVTSWLAPEPHTPARSSIYAPLTLLLSLPIWPALYLLALLGVTMLSITLLWTTWHDAPPSLASVAWICASCALGLSVASFLVYLPRFMDFFDYATSRTALGPGFFAALGGYALVLLGSLMLARP